MRMRALSLPLIFLIAATSFAGDMAPPPPQEHPVFGEIAQAMDPAQLQSSLTTLVGFGTRQTLSDTRSDKRGIGAARRWVQARFQQISKDCGGCLRDHHALPGVQRRAHAQRGRRSDGHRGHPEGRHRS